MKLFIAILFCSVLGNAKTQSVFSLNQDTLSYFGLKYENDFFAGTDRYYTQGIELEYRQNKLKFKHIQPLFFTSDSARYQFILKITHEAFTPSTIRADSILPNDRPYAALLYASFRFSTFTKNQLRYYWCAQIGIIGPAAFGEEMQTGIHKATHNFLPLGWGNQLKNNLVMNGQVGIARQFGLLKNIFIVEPEGIATFGTIHTDLLLRSKLSIGLNKFPSYLRFFYLPAVRFVAWDGTLSGFPLGNQQLAAVSRSEVSSIVSEQQLGIEFRLNRIQFSAFKYFQSKLFKSAGNHQWGGLSLAFLF